MIPQIATLHLRVVAFPIVRIISKSKKVDSYYHEYIHLFAQPIYSSHLSSILTSPLSASYPHLTLWVSQGTQPSLSFVFPVSLLLTVPF